MNVQASIWFVLTDEVVFQLPSLSPSLDYIPTPKILHEIEGTNAITWFTA